MKVLVFNAFFQTRITQLIPLYLLSIGYALVSDDLWIVVYVLIGLFTLVQILDVGIGLRFLLGDDSEIKHNIIGQYLHIYKFEPDSSILCSFTNYWYFEYIFWVPLAFIAIQNEFDYIVLLISFLLALSGALSIIINNVIDNNIDYLED